MDDYNQTKLSNEQVAEILQSALDDKPFSVIDGSLLAPQPKRGHSLSPDQIEMHNELAKLRQASYKRQMAKSKMKPKT